MAPQNQALSELLNLLTPGLRISVTFDFGGDDQYAFSTVYVGAKPDSYLIFELPTKVKEALVIRKINNVDAIVRAITNTKLGHVVAFKATVLSVVSQPYHLVFLRMPTHFATKPVREHERFMIDSPVELSSNNVSYSGKMIDFSVSGCAIYISGQNELSESNIIEIRGELDDYLPEGIKYTIVKIIKENGGHRLGIRFNQPVELDDKFRRALLELSHSSTKF
jgi:hypothetical protein